ncbi:hypothetical protein MCUN1_000476 [Malassezia cuniculi]|uniref:Thiamine phosphate synthase/TenI domain-containing protein n=1 Tax=Malassezia cuniculi TaxID=948313 RepID=A0AAF0EN80_9BASI|nr:hypothetical protein MCUN1_000476 [Malassezia cuniculi]
MTPHDYSLYLVTGRELLPPGKDYYESLHESLRDGKVSVVQVREKHASTDEFKEIAEKTLEVCDKYGVRMIVNDNVDVAAALPERVGLHIGQEDAKLAYARSVLGAREIGVSVKTAEQAREAVAGGADYVGIGPCWETSSKAGITAADALMLTKSRDVVAGLAGDRYVPCVLIGGINVHNAMRTLSGASTASRHPDGVAVISAIVSQRHPDVAAAQLRGIVDQFKQERSAVVSATLSGKDIYDNIASHYKSGAPPLVQTITSHVSSHFSANIALAFASSPIMSHESEEADDLSKAIRALVLNIGTVTEDALRGMRATGTAANACGTPIVLDPVGVGASRFRYQVIQDILNRVQVSLIKGNAAELCTMIGSNEATSQGVDSVGRIANPEEIVRKLALQEGAIVVLTGATDYVSNGEQVYSTSSGSPLLGRITASGCALGVVLAAALASAATKHNVVLGDAESQRLRPPRLHDALFYGAIAGLEAYNYAAEVAAKEAAGPGTFIPRFLDALASFDSWDADHFVQRF